MRGLGAAPSTAACARRKSFDARRPRRRPRAQSQLHSACLEALESRTLLTATLNNVLVNNPALDTTPQDTQSETTLLVFGSTVLSAYNDSGSNAIDPTKFTGYSRSTDGGATFTDMGQLPNDLNGDAGDPVLVRDNTSGAIYLATLSNGASNVIQVFKSTDGGMTFAAPINGLPGAAGGSLDKEWLAVDNFTGSGQGNVYLVVRDFGNANAISFTRSTNGGTSFGPSGGTTIVSGNDTQGAWVAVGPDHSVYVFWLDAAAAQQRIMMRKSTDLGVSFAAPVTVATLNTSGGNGDFGLGFRTDAFPQAVVNPVNGDIYVAYPDKGAGTDRCNIYFTQSTNGGAAWSAPVKVNDDATTHDQWQPALAIQPDGTELFIGFYDRRNDPANALIDTYGVIGDIDGSTVTFRPNFKISTTSFPAVYGADPAINPIYMGDYDNAAADNSGFYYTWADNRDASLGHAGKQANVRFAKIPTNLTVTDSTPSDGAVIATQPANFTINLSEEYEGASVQPSDLTVNGIAADAVTLTSPTTLTFHFNTSPVMQEGLQTMAIAGGTISRLSDSKPIAPFVAHFRYDLMPLTVTSTLPASGSSVILPLTSIDVHFSEAYDPASISTADVSINQGLVSGFVLVDAQAVRYLLSGISTEGTINLSLPAGAVTDVFGNPSLAFSWSLIADIGVVAFPTPLASRSPQGSMIFGSSASAVIGAAGDTDSFTIHLDAGQTLTLTVTAASTLQPTVQVMDRLGLGDGGLASDGNGGDCGDLHDHRRRRRRKPGDLHARCHAERRAGN